MGDDLVFFFQEFLVLVFLLLFKIKSRKSIFAAEETITLSFVDMVLSILFLKMGQTRPLFVYFRSFHMTNIAQIL